MPLQRSLAWTALLTLWAAIFGMYLLGRALGMRFAGALMAGIVYGLNLWLVSHLSYPHSAVWALLPWLLLGDRAARAAPRRRRRSPLLARRGRRCSTSPGTPRRASTSLLATVAFFALRARSHARRERDAGCAPRCWRWRRRSWRAPGWRP